MFGGGGLHVFSCYEPFGSTKSSSRQMHILLLNPQGVEFTDLTRLVGLGPSLESEWIFRYVTYVTHMTDTCNEQKSSKRT